MNLDAREAIAGVAQVLQVTESLAKLQSSIASYGYSVRTFAKAGWISGSDLEALADLGGDWIAAAYDQTVQLLSGSVGDLLHPFGVVKGHDLGIFIDEGELQLHRTTAYVVNMPCALSELPPALRDALSGLFNACEEAQCGFEHLETILSSNLETAVIYQAFERLPADCPPDRRFDVCWRKACELLADEIGCEMTEGEDITQETAGLWQDFVSFGGFREQFSRHISRLLAKQSSEASAAVPPVKKLTRKEKEAQAEILRLTALMSALKAPEDVELRHLDDARYFGEGVILVTPDLSSDALDDYFESTENGNGEIPGTCFERLPSLRSAAQVIAANIVLPKVLSDAMAALGLRA